MPTQDTTRFSDRVEDYLKARPSYPTAVLDWLCPDNQIDKTVIDKAVIADIGSGTGILSDLFLQRGHEVYAVEPNTEMRSAAEEKLGSKSGFNSVDGTAEETGLEPELVNLIVCGQAFHWFDAVAAKAEFRRILAPKGRVALIWNDRDVDGFKLMREYEVLLGRWGDGRRKRGYGLGALGETLDSFFNSEFETLGFPSSQTLNEAGLVGRFFSCSYTPSKDAPEYRDAARAVRKLFARHQSDGVVELGYRTRMHYGVP